MPYSRKNFSSCIPGRTVPKEFFKEHSRKNAKNTPGDSSKAHRDGGIQEFLEVFLDELLNLHEDIGGLSDGGHGILFCTQDGTPSGNHGVHT